jgi:hypothetical protein
MKSYFACSLCHNGLLGGGLIVDENTITYKTGKITADKKYSNLKLSRNSIKNLSWKRIVFPIATFEMKDGEKYSFMIFNKWRFIKVYNL